MRQILIVILAIILFQISSCGPKEEYHVTFTILNNSDHKIELFIFKYDNSSDTILLPYNGNDTVIIKYQEGYVSGPPPFVTDSVMVIYDDSISIVHYRTAIQDASRSLINSKSWTGGNIVGHDYVWEYLFTNDDYEEAVLFQ